MFDNQRNISPRIPVFGTIGVSGIVQLDGRDGIRTRDREVRNLSPYPLGHTPQQEICWEKKNGYGWSALQLINTVISLT